jgi:WD40 repeat protein
MSRRNKIGLILVMALGLLLAGGYCFYQYYGHQERMEWMERSFAGQQAPVWKLNKSQLKLKETLVARYEQDLNEMGWWVGAQRQAAQRENIRKWKEEVEKWSKDPGWLALWRSGELEYNFMHHDLVWNANGTRMAIVGLYANEVNTIDVGVTGVFGQRHRINDDAGNARPPRIASFAVSGNLLATVDVNARVFVFNIGNPGAAPVLRQAFVIDGLVLPIMWDNIFKQPWEAPPFRDFSLLAFLPDGNTLAVLGDKKSQNTSLSDGPATVAFCSVRDGKVLKRLALDTKLNTPAALSPDARFAAIAEPMSSGNLHGRIWDLATGEAKAKFDAPFSMGAMYFSPDGTGLALGVIQQFKGGMLMLDPLTGKQRWLVWFPAEMAGPSGSLVFSRDGKRLAIDHFGIPRIIDVATGETQLDFRSVVQVTERTALGITMAPEPLRFSPGNWAVAWMPNDSGLAVCGGDRKEFWEFVSIKGPRPGNEPGAPAK